MVKSKSVTIIIVNWNGINDTIECIESLNKINYEDFSVFVVDNNSIDKINIEVLQEIAKKYDKVKVIFNSINSGFAGGNNLGITYAKALNPDYYLLINNDTIVDNNFLINLIACAESSDAGIVAPVIYYYSQPEKVWSAGGKISKLKGSGFHNSKLDSKKTLCKEVTFVSGCCMLIKKEIIDRIGLLDESYFLYLEDTDYCARVIKSGFKIYLAYNSIIYHKVSQSISKFDKPLSLYYVTRNRLFFIKKHYPIFLPLSFLYLIFTMSIKFVYWAFSGHYSNIRITILAFIDFIKGKKGEITHKY